MLTAVGGIRATTACQFYFEFEFIEESARSSRNSSVAVKLFRERQFLPSRGVKNCDVTWLVDSVSGSFFSKTGPGFVFHRSVTPWER
jgi:hypothetical protein